MRRKYRFIVVSGCAHMPFAVDKFRHFFRFFRGSVFLGLVFCVKSMELESLFFPSFDHFHFLFAQS